MMKKFLLILALLMVVIVLGHLAEAYIIWVNPNNPTPEAPYDTRDKGFQTFDDAMYYAVAGDLIKQGNIVVTEDLVAPLTKDTSVGILLLNGKGILINGKPVRLGRYK